MISEKTFMIINKSNTKIKAEKKAFIKRCDNRFIKFKDTGLRYAYLNKNNRG